MSFSRQKAGRLLASLAIAAGAVVAIDGFATSVTGKSAQKLAPGVESVEPARDALQVQQQDQIRADLVAGYTGVLIVNGVELPTYSLDKLPTPAKGQQLSLPPRPSSSPAITRSRSPRRAKP